MKRTIALSLLILAAGLAGPVVAQAPTSAALPTGEAILAKYVTATGGAAHEAVKSRVVHAKMEIVDAGVTFSVTVYQAKPDRIVTVAESDAVGRIESGVTDGVAWENSALRGARIKAGQERDDALRDATFDRLVAWKKFNKSVECVGLETVEGKQSFKVVMTPAVGSAQTVYFDRESGLIVRSESEVNVPEGKFQVVSIPGDYRQVDGIRMPFSSRVSVAGQTRIVTTERVEHNVEIPADRLALPAEIKALVAAKKE